MIIIEKSTFHGSLLELIGKEKKEILETLAPPPSREIGKGGAERWMWGERVKDSEKGVHFNIYLCARFFDGKVWAVGIWSSEFFFVLEKGTKGKHYFAAVPKGPAFKMEDVNWITRGEEGPVEIGVEG